MFEDLLYLLRRNGLKVSLTEWMALMEGLHKNLHNASFTGFYHLCRCLLVKSEADFDCFDRCFLEYFKDVKFEQEVSQELMDWLDSPGELLCALALGYPGESPAPRPRRELSQLVEWRTGEQSSSLPGASKGYL